ncbi:MAG: sugar ABC transporter permease [Geminicoccaceae bacterium]
MRNAEASVGAGAARGPARLDRLTVIILFLPPALLLFTIFVILPMGEAMYFSVFRWNGFGRPEEFMGLRNFERLVSHRAFGLALRNNALIIGVSLLVQLPLALALALALAQRLRGTYAFRLILFLPYVLADIAAGLIWRFVYDGDYGLVTGIMGLFGLPPVYILGDRDLAIWAILAVIVWKYFGFHMMLFIAGLQGIDKDYYEAARIDGAGRFAVFRYVTLPMLAPTIRLSIFFAVLGSLQFFDMIMPLTKGGPSDSTQTLVTYLYNFGVTRMQIGFGSAVGVVLFVICVVFAFTYKATAICAMTEPAPSRPTAPPFELFKVWRWAFLLFVAGLVLVPLLATALGGFKSLGDLRTNRSACPRPGSSRTISASSGRHALADARQLALHRGLHRHPDGRRRGHGGLPLRAPHLLRRPLSPELLHARPALPGRHRRPAALHQDPRPRPARHLLGRDPAADRLQPRLRHPPLPPLLPRAAREPVRRRHDRRLRLCPLLLARHPAALAADPLHRRRLRLRPELEQLPAAARPSSTPTPCTPGRSASWSSSASSPPNGAWSSPSSR